MEMSEHQQVIIAPEWQGYDETGPRPGLTCLAARLLRAWASLSRHRLTCERLQPADSLETSAESSIDFESTNAAVALLCSVNRREGAPFRYQQH